MIKQITDFIRKDMQKIGGRQLPAMGRSGGKEIGQIFPAFPDSIDVQEEYGLIGNTLPSEVAEQKTGPNHTKDHNMELER